MTIRDKAQELVLSNLSSVLTYESEDEKRSATFAELASAIECASDVELVGFLDTREIVYEDGFIKMEVK